MRVTWTPLAYEQLDTAMAYIAADRPATAGEWLERLLDAAADLADFPNQGRVVDEARRDDIRELIVSPYRIVYRRDPDHVYIAMVLHERQQVEAKDLG
jgi:toxin ParE1/3/4